MINLSARAEATSMLLRLRVLIVEDSWNVAQAIKSILETAGAHVRGPVSSVKDAIDLIRTEPVTVALVDMRLRDGFADDLIAELIGRDIPFIIVTAFESLPTNADSQAVGVIRKPVDADELIAVVSRFVAG